MLVTGIVAVTDVTDAATTRRTSSVTVYNPFNMWAELELKCNWDGKKFEHRRIYRLPERSNVKVSIPNGSQCQLWPRIE